MERSAARSVVSAIIAGVFLAAIFSLGTAAAETTAAFERPLNVDDWRTDIAGRNGIYRFKQVRGTCQITFGQNLGAEAAKAAGGTPRDSLENYVRQLSSQAGEVTRSKAPDLKLRATGGDPIAFAAEEVAYRGKDGVGYRNRIATQWVGPIELLVISACPAKDWKAQQGAIEVFLGKVSVRR